jgi:hypothetical protein
VNLGRSSRDALTSRSTGVFGQKCGSYAHFGRAETAVAASDWKRAWGPSQVALFTARRGFLPGYETPWIDVERNALVELELRAPECYAAASLGIGGAELAGAERSARKLVDREPFRESGHRILMNALADRGNVADAMRVYQRLARRLRHELGVDPSPPTRELHRKLLQLTLRPSAARHEDARQK